MKAQFVLSFLLLVSSSLMAMAEIESLSQGRSLVGRVGVGDHTGAMCIIAVKSVVHDIYSLRYDTMYSEYLPKSGKWKLNSSQAFSIQNYSGDYTGSSFKTTSRGQKKIVVSLFFDGRTQAYKAILHENYVGAEDISTSKFTICEGMTLR